MYSKERGKMLYHQKNILLTSLIFENPHLIYIACRLTVDSLSFQNARFCGPLQGIPMVASSPVKHENHIPMNPIEVQSYQQKWQPFNTYRIKNQMDEAPLQQLVSVICQLTKSTYYLDTYNFAYINSILKTKRPH